MFRSFPPNPILVKSKRVESLHLFNFVNFKPEESYKSAEENRRESKTKCSTESGELAEALPTLILKTHLKTKKSVRKLREKHLEVSVYQKGLFETRRS